jgi:hypothetical protein
MTAFFKLENVINVMAIHLSNYWNFISVLPVSSAFRTLLSWEVANVSAN